MSPDSNPDHARGGAKPLLLLILAAGGLTAAAAFLGGAFDSSVPAPEEPSVGPGTSPDLALESAAVLETAPPEVQVREGPGEDSPTLVHCTQSATGAALAGVRLYRGRGPKAESIAGPSDTAGTLEVPDAPVGGLTLWTEGWSPVAVRGESLPTEVAFQVARGSLEVRFQNFTLEHRFLRSLFEPRTAGPPSAGPWAPTLEERAPGLFIAERVVVGSYDLYLWVVYPDGDTRSFSRKSFEVGEGGPTRLSIDLAAPQDPDDLESDG